MKINEKLIIIRPMPWEEVFEIWERGEALLPRWIEHYKQRGYTSWKEWRQHTLAELAPENLKWNLFEVKDPLTEIPKFRGGPFRSWIKNYYGNETSPTFSEIAKDEAIANSTIIQQMIEQFPTTTTIIGLRTHEGIVVVEGMHRCSALALASNLKIPIKTHVQLIAADYLDSQIPTMGQETSPAA